MAQRDSANKKATFWEYLEEKKQKQKTDNAWNEGKVFYLQEYLNAWLDCGIIPGDPNSQNESGKHRHVQLSVVNSLPLGDLPRRAQWGSTGIWPGYCWPDVPSNR